MGAPRLPVVPQLRHRPLLAIRNEDRVVAEAFGAERRERDPTVERAGAAQLATIGSEEHELRDVTPAPIRDALELAEELRHRRGPLRRVARRQHARPAPQGFHLEARVLREHPAVRVLAAELSLDAGVVVVGGARLGRVVVAVERLECPARQQPLELTCLVPVPRTENRGQSVHCTSSTPSSSATPATTPTAVVPGGSSTSAATERRSPSCVTSSERTRPPARSIASMIGPGLPPAGISTRSRSRAGRKPRSSR